MKKTKSLSENIALTVAKDGLELPAEITEFAIDQVIDDGLLKDIPVVGWIAKGLSISQSISDRIFFHKILSFLIELENTGIAERNNFNQKIKDDKKFKKRVGEHLIMMLDKIDTIKKTALIAGCFKFFIEDVISHEYFIDLSNVVVKSSISDLESLCVTSNKRVLFNSISMAASSGLLEYGIAKNDEEIDLGHRLSEYAHDIRDIYFGKEPNKYVSRIERKIKYEKDSVKIKQKHIQQATKAKKMKSMNKTDSEIMEELSIDKYMLQNYLSFDGS